MRVSVCVLYVCVFVATNVCVCLWQQDSGKPQSIPSNAKSMPTAPAKAQAGRGRAAAALPAETAAKSATAVGKDRIAVSKVAAQAGWGGAPASRASAKTKNSGAAHNVSDANVAEILTQVHAAPVTAVIHDVSSPTNASFQEGTDGAVMHQAHPHPYAHQPPPYLAQHGPAQSFHAPHPHAHLSEPPTYLHPPAPGGWTMQVLRLLALLVRKYKH